MAYNAELQQLREITYLLLGHKKLVVCCFCGNPLLIARGINATYGHRRHTSITERLTVHHNDEDRENNDFSNLDLAHRECHKAYHNHKRAQNENPPE